MAANEITYRKISFSDRDFLFDWANDPGTRLNSFYSDPIAYNEHVAWFEKKLENFDLFYLIAELDEEPCAFVRFDSNEEETVIGINIGPKFRGKGLAAQILSDCCLLYFEEFAEDVQAYIKEENIASIRSFEKAGFNLVEKVKINNFNAFKYTRKQ